MVFANIKAACVQVLIPLAIRHKDIYVAVSLLVQDLALLAVTPARPIKDGPFLVQIAHVLIVAKGKLGMHQVSV